MTWGGKHGWYNLSDAVRAGDAASTEIAVRFIEDRFIASVSDTDRARALEFAEQLKDASPRFHRRLVAALT